MMYIGYTLLAIIYIICMLLTARYMYRNNFGGSPWTILLFGGGFWPIMVTMILIAHSLSWAIHFVTKPKQKETSWK